MNIDELYDKLSNGNVNTFGEAVKVRNGFFAESDPITVFSGGLDLYFSIDKFGMLELFQQVYSRIDEIKSTDDFNRMIELFKIIESQINEYFGHSNQNLREKYYIQNGHEFQDESRMCYMSEIKGKGLAKCAEKSSVANNLLLMLREMNIFPYDINYINSLIEMPNEKGGHAFLGFSRVNSKGNKMYLLYDITNPEIVQRSGKDFNYPAVYSLNEQTFSEFLQGGSFDNSHFILNQFYPVKEKRTYSGFYIEKEEDLQQVKEDLQQAREEHIKMMNENYENPYAEQFRDGTRANDMDLPTQKSGMRR